MSKEVIEPWAEPMVAAKLVDRRNGKASMRALAEKAGTTTSTISAMIHGTRDTGADVLERVAVALDVPVDRITQWAGKVRTEVKPFTPHRDANLLTAEEQQAVNELIRLLALPKREKGGGADGFSAAPTKPPLRPVSDLELDDAAYDPKKE